MSVRSAAARRPAPRVAAPRIDRFEAATLAALVALSFAALAGLVLRVWLKGGVVTGGDGFLVADPLQYLNWLRQAGEGVGIANLYDLAPGPSPFVHPGLLISGLLHAAGVGLVAAYSVWKPVAAVALFAGALALARRFLHRRDDRRAALVAALFFASPVAAVVGWSGVGGDSFKLDIDFVTGELWSGNWLWGYQFSALAVGLLPLGLLAYERGRAGGSRAMLGWAAGAALVVSWLQPWQGATLAITLVAGEAWFAWRRQRSPLGAARDLAVPLAAGAAPLVYYLVLSLTDPSWELAGEVNAMPRWSLLVTALGLAPLALPALLAIGAPARGFGDVLLRAWPLAGLAVFYLPVGTFPFHAFQGLAFPLAVLAVVGLRHRLGARPLPAAATVAVLALLIVPGTVYRATELRDAVAKGYQPFFLETAEHDALRWLDRAPEEGGVLAPVYTGLAVPAYTGRETYVGAGSWSPDFDRRVEQMEALFGGRMEPAAARRLVRRTGARFLLVDCHGRADIAPLVDGVARPAARFGCASVWRVTAGESR